MNYNLQNLFSKIRTLAEQNGELPSKQVLILIVCLAAISPPIRAMVDTYGTFWFTATWTLIGLGSFLGGNLVMFLARIKIRKHRMFYFSVGGFFMFFGVNLLLDPVFKLVFKS